MFRIHHINRNKRSYGHFNYQVDENQGTLQMPKILTGRLEMLLECFKLDTKCIHFNILYILDYIVSFL